MNTACERELREDEKKNSWIFIFQLGYLKAFFIINNPRFSYEFRFCFVFFICDGIFFKKLYITSTQVTTQPRVVEATTVEVGMACEVKCAQNNFQH